MTVVGAARSGKGPGSSKSTAAVTTRPVEVNGFDGPRPQIVRYAEVALPMNSTRRGEVVETSTVVTALSGPAEASAA